jgi:tetratricopeptide (TPR) repeat protein
MGVHQFMLGRELPCTVVDLLEIRLMPLPGATHDALVRQVDAGGRAYPDVLYRLGLSHLGRQELGLAKQRLSAAVAQKPDYAPARLALAAVCDLLAQHAEAVDHLDAVITSDKPVNFGPSSDAPKVTRYHLLCAAGFCLERVGTPGAAAFRYEEALAHEPTDLFAHHRLAAIYVAHNQLEQAVEHHKAILNHEPQEQAVRTSLAHLLQLLGRHKEAVWEYEKALCLDPDNWDLQMELAEQFERMGNSDAAIDRLRVLCEKNPQFPDLHLRLANLYSTRGDDRGATAEYAEALSVHPDYLDCHIAAARHELKMGRTEQALEHFQRAITINNQNVEAYAGLSVALHRLGKVEQAKEMLAAAWKIGHNSDVLVAQLGQLELQAEAAESVDAAFDPGQQAATATDDREQQRQWIEEQIERYEQILDQHPTWTDVRVRHGMLLKLVGRWHEAADAFDHATRQNPSYVEAWVQLALARREAGNTTGAMKALETAIQIKPEYADLHYRLGLIYCSEMEFDLAMERMEEAVALNGKNPDFQRHLWVVLQGLQMNGRRRTSAEMEERTHDIADAEVAPD